MLTAWTTFIAFMKHFLLPGSLFSRYLWCSVHGQEDMNSRQQSLNVSANSPPLFSMNAISPFSEPVPPATTQSSASFYLHPWACRITIFPPVTLAFDPGCWLQAKETAFHLLPGSPALKESRSHGIQSLVWVSIDGDLQWISGAVLLATVAHHR